MKIIVLSMWLCISLLAAGTEGDALKIWRNRQGEGKAIGRFFPSFKECSVILGKKSADQSITAGEITLEPMETSEEYAEDELVRVRIVFDEEAVEAVSIDALIERISGEALGGEELDVRRKGIGGNGISAYLAFGRIEEVRGVEGVKSVELEKQYGLHEEPDETTAAVMPENTAAEPEEDVKATEFPEEESGMETSADKEPEGDSQPQKAAGSPGIAAGAGIGALAVLAGCTYFKIKRKKQ